ncbi:MAG: hypothetical protein LBU78_09790 [Microbacterium sp.]|jgi:hypothetical protein|nr:hypothetical protein [Microbacterium sp.]
MSTTVLEPRRSRIFLGIALPLAAGVLAAFAIGSQTGVAPVIMVCAAIYLFAAAIGRRWASWAGFGISFLVLAPGFVLDDPWIPIITLGAIQIVLVIVGLVRGAWRTRVNLLQLAGAVLFSALAVAAAAGAAPWAGIVTVFALLAHGAWDLWHHHLDAVVMRSYALFCASLDIVLAVIVAVAMIAGV